MKIHLSKPTPEGEAIAAENLRRRNARIDQPAQPPHPIHPPTKPIDLTKLTTSQKLALGLRQSRQQRSGGSS